MPEFLVIKLSYNICTALQWYSVFSYVIKKKIILAGEFGGKKKEAEDFAVMSFFSGVMNLNIKIQYMSFVNEI